MILYNSNLKYLKLLLKNLLTHLILLLSPAQMHYQTLNHYKIKILHYKLLEIIKKWLPPLKQRDNNLEVCKAPQKNLPLTIRNDSNTVKALMMQSHIPPPLLTKASYFCFLFFLLTSLKDIKHKGRGNGYEQSNRRRDYDSKKHRPTIDDSSSDHSSHTQSESELKVHFTVMGINVKDFDNDEIKT